MIRVETVSKGYKKYFLISARLREVVKILLTNGNFQEEKNNSNHTINCTEIQNREKLKRFIDSFYYQNSKQYFLPLQTAVLEN
ncbi:MAG: hypothetical protein B6D37_14060 [Sphingobacteriales bacterium UTBCD1]|jgi:hypothetical protein|nr:MAG: hypothetical protein B6D37_14060 [Sphingobacteriales bacterium UTBCD1]